MLPLSAYRTGISRNRFLLAGRICTIKSKAFPNDVKQAHRPALAACCNHSQQSTTCGQFKTSESTKLDNVYSTSMRSHNIGQLDSSLTQKSVSLCGWAERIRIVSRSLCFIVLRDRYGTIQVVFNRPELGSEGDNIWETLNKLSEESVVKISGQVLARSDNTKTAEQPSNSVKSVEIKGLNLEILNPAKELPFHPFSKKNLPKELVRLESRYLDLRRPGLQENIITRAKVVRTIRNYMDNMGFMDIETPVLFKSTPEGAREFLVPSRTAPGACYALPQSPQQFKQLLMVSGFDRYYQISKCFRDEDLRADRQPEFTQVDIEMSFIKPKDIQNIIEGLMKKVLKEVKNIDLSTPFKRLTFQEATSTYGSDKPDTRFELKIQQFEETGVELEGCISEVLAVKKKIHELNKREVSDIMSAIKKSIESGESELTNVHTIGADFLPVKENKTSFLYRLVEKHGMERASSLIKSMGIGVGDTIFVSERLKLITPANTTLGRARLFLGKHLNEIGAINYTTEFNFLWVEKFPLFTIEPNDADHIKTTHHPFTAPESAVEQEKMLDELGKDAQQFSKLFGMHYDLVLNDVELGGGSIRVHNPELQSFILSDILKISEDTRSRLNHLILALGHGCPPHGGIALGLDRLILMLCNTNSLRDVIAFPKSSDGRDLLFKAPALATTEELAGYHLKSIKS